MNDAIGTPRLKHNVGGAFLTDMISGLGLDKATVEASFKDFSKRSLGLDARLREIRKDISNRKSTFDQYIRLKNLFLVRVYSIAHLI